MNELPVDDILYEKDENGREIKIFKLTDVFAEGLYYPSISFMKRYGPIRERVMSLDSLLSIKHVYITEERPMFFFVYNVDNYYHFVYDTLPYLISYRHLRKSIPGLKLLINFASKQQKQLNRFVLEFLELLDIGQEDLVFIDPSIMYDTVYISSSYTHDHDSNAPPRKEIYNLYRELANKIEEQPDLPKKIYISRRSHIHGKYDNIGTNYTSRRRLVNEDELVALLEQQGYKEVFTELMSTKDKIAMFKGATHVAGAIGGGLCNVLFSKPSTKLTCIVSPSFLDINSRFRYSFKNVDVKYFHDTKHADPSRIKKYMRAWVPNLGTTGEIIHISPHGLLTIQYSSTAVAGWNANGPYNEYCIYQDGVTILDPGLNSEWTMDLEKFTNE